MNTIDAIIGDILLAEGGYVNDPADSGGETNFGITVAVARANGYTGDMRNLPKTLAESIYRKRYVNDPGFDKVAELNMGVAAELIDTGVNMGPQVAGQFLQRWLNGLANATLTVDGKIGPATLAALNGYLQARGNDGVQVLLKGLNCSQGARYLELSENRTANRKFLFGWLRARVSI